MSSRYIPTDPLFVSQWHLLNEGQDIMGLPQDKGAYRNDINVTRVWNEYTGKGVVVGVYDDGFQVEHPDLSPNIISGKFYNALTHRLESPEGNGHGTSTMGLILAAKNGKGGVGVAYDSTGIGYTGLGHITSGTSTIHFPEAAARMLLDGVDISSNSWSFQPPNGQKVSPFSAATHQESQITAQMSLAQLGRNGLGTINLFAAGNGNNQKDNTVFSPTTNSPYVIAVAAANANGSVSSYSTHGPAVLIAAPGSGNQITDDANHVASIVTTDLLGSAGSNKSKDGDYTNFRNNVLKPDGNLDREKSSHGFNGTSAATPIAAGVVALMLEANSNLGYRDVQEILAYSAKNPDYDTTNGVPYWQTNNATDWNGGGHRYNDSLGFGHVDAHAAVRLAETWDKKSTFSNMAHLQDEFEGGGLLTSDGYAVVGAEGQLEMTASIVEPMRIQHVTVTVDMFMQDKNFSLHDINLTLKGPSGQRTALMNPKEYAENLNPPNKLSFSFDIVQHWGEINYGGNWTISVVNDNLQSAVDVKANISLIGDEYESKNTFIYTDDYRNIGKNDPSRALLSSTTPGPHTLNAAAVTSDTVIDLVQHTATIAGVATHIGDSMQFASLITGDGNDRLTGVDTADSMTAGRGDDTLHGGGGQDTLSGGRGDDQIFGQDGNDSVLGGDGNDFVSGGFGSDTVIGEAGNDLLFGDDDNDLIDGSEGDDTVHGGTGIDTMFGSGGNDQVYGEDGADFLGTGEGHDFGSGGFGNDEVHGEEGNDLLFGDDGNDGVYGEDGDDLVYGGTGNDYLTGDAGNDQVFGEGDDDGLSGGAGNDTLDGGTGADLLFGNSGDDVLTGGAGIDVFAFGTGDGLDRILDFVLGGAEADVIAFNGGAFADLAGVQAASRQDGADLVIAYGAGDALTLAGVQLGSLSAANFTFA